MFWCRQLSFALSLSLSLSIKYICSLSISLSLFIKHIAGYATRKFQLGDVKIQGEMIGVATKVGGGREDPLRARRHSCEHCGYSIYVKHTFRHAKFSTRLNARGPDIRHIASIID